jgi:hypothetical protein
VNLELYEPPARAAIEKALERNSKQLLQQTGDAPIAAQTASGRACSPIRYG